MKTIQNCARKFSLSTAAAAALWLAAPGAEAQTPPAIAPLPASAAVAPGSTVNFTIAVTGTGPLFYQWRFNGSNIPSVITTVAGDGPDGNTGSFAGDLGQATNAFLNVPVGVAVDSSNRLYIADTGNSRIRRVATNGIITTFAGNGTNSFSGDGKQATNAGFNLPQGVCVDSNGNVFITDTGNNRIRKIALTGIISTIAGGGTNGTTNGAATNATLNAPAATAVDAAGNLFIADSGNNRIRKVATNGVITTVVGGGSSNVVSGLMATNANISDPNGIAVDRFGNLYVCCESQGLGSGPFVVGTNGVITLLAPAPVFGEGYFVTPWGVALDARGNLFVGNAGANVVVTTNPLQPLAGDAVFASGSWLPAAGGFSGDGGPANQAALDSPRGVTADIAGNVFIADELNNRIRKVVALGPLLSLTNVTSANAGNYDVIISSPFGSSTSSVVALSVGTPPGVPGLSGNQAIILGSNGTLNATAAGTGPFEFQWRLNGINLPVTINTVAGNGTASEFGDGGPAISAELYAGAVAADAFGNFFIADSANDRVREVNSNGIIRTAAGNGTPGFSGDGGFATNAGLYNPSALAVDGSGNLYIADEANNRIREVRPSGIITTVAGTGQSGFSGDGGAATNADLSDPTGVAVDPSGNIYIADRLNNRIREVGTNGVIMTVAGNGTSSYSGDGGAAANASLSNPEAVAADALGNIFIADSGNKRIRRISVNGVIVTVAGNGDAGYFGDGGPATSAFIESPASVAVDGFGNIFIADGTQHVREVNAAGIISTVAGNAGLGFSGDGGPATNSMLSETYGVAADPAGNLFIADTGNSRVREITGAGPALLLTDFNTNQAGNYDVIVSNPFGSVTSAVTMVTVQLPPPPALPALGVSLSNGIVVIQFSGTAGSNYVLFATGDLTPPAAWQPVGTNAAGPSGSGTFLEIPVAPVQFYRLGLPSN
ncbi:MAG TPA: SBBP repeat-containing protein [Verrucomicrobiae bacterium]|jgi:sugar lactone lactonase YvrE